MMKIEIARNNISVPYLDNLVLKLNYHINVTYTVLAPRILLELLVHCRRVFILPTQDERVLDLTNPL